MKDNKFKCEKRKKTNNIKRKAKKSGRGLLNKMIDKLPFEMHIPSYQYCGPGDCKISMLEKTDLTLYRNFTINRNKTIGTIGPRRSWNQ